MGGVDVNRVAEDLLAVLGTGRQVGRLPGLSLAEGYRVAARICALRRERGERTLGRKIGFTNTTIWERYGVTGPMWNFVYDSSVRDAAAGPYALAGLSQPRIEPEIVLHLARAPEPGLEEAALIECVDWIAHGFEIVQSVYPDWVMTGAEAAAAFGLHGGLAIGPRHDITGDRAAWADRLAGFSITLSRDGALRDRGVAGNVLGGPLSALRFLVDEIARYPGSERLAAGEIVTTGTLTDAQPVAPGETWRTALEGLPVDGLELTFVDTRRPA